jgi:hypothetical protein
VILHAAKDDEAVARRLDLVGEDTKSAAEAERCNLAFDQPLGRLRQRPLRFADTDRERAALRLAGFDEQLAEEVRLAGAAPAVHALVAGGFEQRLERLCGWNF